MKALYKAMIYLMDYVEEQTPERHGGSYGHPARELIRDLQAELQEMQELEKEFEPNGGVSNDSRLQRKS